MYSQPKHYPRTIQNPSLLNVNFSSPWVPQATARAGNLASIAGCYLQWWEHAAMLWEAALSFSFQELPEEVHKDLPEGGLLKCDLSDDCTHNLKETVLWWNPAEDPCSAPAPTKQIWEVLKTQDDFAREVVVKNRYQTCYTSWRKCMHLNVQSVHRAPFSDDGGLHCVRLRIFMGGA